MLENALAFEMAAVRVYTEALAVAEGDRALVVFLEDMLKAEQEGVDEFVKIVRDLPQIAKEQEQLHKAG
jgi:bacterioferritin